MIDIARLVDAPAGTRPDIDGAGDRPGHRHDRGDGVRVRPADRSDKPVVVTGAMRDVLVARFRRSRATSPTRCAMRRISRAGAAPASWSSWAARRSRPTRRSRHIRPRWTRSSHGGRSSRSSTAGRPDRAPAADACCRASRRAVEDVHLVTAVVGMDGTLLDAASSATRPRGVVVAATGTGNTTRRAARRGPGADGQRHDRRADHAVRRRARSRRTTRFPGGGATWQQAGALIVGVRRSQVAGRPRTGLARRPGAGRARGAAAWRRRDSRGSADRRSRGDPRRRIRLRLAARHRHRRRSRGRRRARESELEPLIGPHTERWRAGRRPAGRCPASPMRTCI